MHSIVPPSAGLDYVPGGARLVTFQPPGDSVLCTAFEIIDDQLGLEGEERFVVHLRPEDGDVQIGDNDRVSVIILDNDGNGPLSVSVHAIVLWYRVHVLYSLAYTLKSHKVTQLHGIVCPDYPLLLLLCCVCQCSCGGTAINRVQDGP